MATSTAGETWRCLRCGAFVLGEPAARGPAAEAAAVRRGKELRSAFILRVFAVERFLRGIVFAVIAYGLWRFRYSRNTIEQAFNRELPLVRSLLHGLGFNVNHSKLIGLIQHAFKLDPRTLTWLAAGAAVYTLIEFVEGIGLWQGKRWGEYFAMVVTSIFIPYEVYDLITKVTVLRLAAFAINLALVLYLVLTKRLFGARGGKGAYEARLRSASIIESELAALAALDRRRFSAAHATGDDAGPAAGNDAEPADAEPADAEPAAGDDAAHGGGTADPVKPARSGPGPRR
jgi:uncharacterized membrane protein (DUF2068 family)